MITLLESGFSGNKGFEVDPEIAIRQDAYWFGESQGRIVVSVAPDKVAMVQQLVTATGVSYTVLGKVTANDIVVASEAWGTIGEWQTLYDTAIEKLIQ